MNKLNIISAFITGWNEKCGSWMFDPFNDYCYLFNFLSERTWAEARADCVNQGGDLLSITEPFEQAFVQGVLHDGPSTFECWMKQVLSFYFLCKLQKTAAENLSNYVKSKLKSIACLDAWLAPSTGSNHKIKHWMYFPASASGIQGPVVWMVVFCNVSPERCLFSTR